MSERTKNLPRRSCHATPGSNEKMLGKAPGLGADMVFLDLEDSVSPLEKEAAREKVVNAIRSQDWGDTVVCVRVNAWDTEWTYRDVVTVVENAGERLDEIMLPKVENAAQVVALDLLLTQIEKVTGRQSRVGIEAQIETAGDSSTSRRSAPRATASRRSSSAPPTSRRPPRCRCSPVGCRSPSTRATTSTTCSARSSWPGAPTDCR